jgi:hypothetical protein
VLIAGGTAWPLLLVGPQVVVLPLFVFVVVSVALLGYRLGLARRHAVLAMSARRPGSPPRVAAPASMPKVLDTSVAVDGRIVDVVTPPGSCTAPLCCPSRFSTSCRGSLTPATTPAAAVAARDSRRWTPCAASAGLT